MSELTQVPHEGGVVEVQLSRAPVNALSPAFLMDFKAVINALDDDPDVQAVVLSSRFKVFSAGLDLKEAQDFNLDQQFEIVTGLNEGFAALYGCKTPVVAAVNGAAIAGGLFFVLGADWRVAGPRASFGLAEVRVGADFPVGPLEIARAELTPALLRRLMLTGYPVNREVALTHGLCDEPTEAEAVLDTAITAARRLAQSPASTYASIKTQIRGETLAKIRTAIDNGANRPDGGWFTPQTRDAMRAMLGQS